MGVAKRSIPYLGRRRWPCVREINLGATFLEAARRGSSSVVVHVAAAGDRMALWHIVHEQCVPDQRDKGRAGALRARRHRRRRRQWRGDLKGPQRSSPASGHSDPPHRRRRRYSRSRFAQLLARRLGRALLSQRAPAARTAARRHRPGDQRGEPAQPGPIAHPYRLRRAQRACRAHRLSSQSGWTGRRCPSRSAGRAYWARRLDSVDLADVSPFRLLADGVAGAKDDMADETLNASSARHSLRQFRLHPLG